VDEIAVDRESALVTPERWSRIRELFATALETPESERPQFLMSACGNDTDLRAELERLLAGNQDPSWQSPVAKWFPAGPQFAPGDTVAQYRIESRLGEGGMGVVYRAFDARLHREVALKVLPPEHLADPERRQQLISEARAASLNHPNIVTVYEIGSEQGVDFISMEYVEGQSLAHAIPAQGLPLVRALAFAIQIAAALAKAHAAGVIHRDLKPANFVLTGEGQVKLLDFGLARRAPPKQCDTAFLMAKGEISGTVGYTSPEQLRGLALDRRTDLFSFGVVLFEMVTGERPFTGSSPTAVCDTILHAEPRDFGDRPLPEKFRAIVRKLIEKDPANRYGSADEVYRELKELEDSLAPVRPFKLSRNAWIGVGSVMVLASALAGWQWRESSRQRWALETATPEIGRLVDAGEYVKAAALARNARAVLPNNPAIEKLWMRTTGEVSIDSVPGGAEVSIRPYAGTVNVWTPLGKTPLKKIRVPRSIYVWRLAKAGFAAEFFIGAPASASAPGFHPVLNRTLKLRPEPRVPSEMVVVAGGNVGLTYPFSEAPRVDVGDFLIDRHEVTNKEYKKFVDAGGYHEREFWKQPFVKDGHTVRWEDAIAIFHDATGRPGPATWVAGDYPEGRETYPVGGVSWYEAAAYAEFAGKSLPSAYHWMLASQAQGFAPEITAGSNFRGEGPQPVGKEGALSGSGTTDMAGNVKEWCLNEARDSQRIILGGGFGEPAYMFNHTDAQSPWNRQANVGFRCVKLDSPPTAAARARIDVTARDYWHEKPVSDDVFKAYSALYVYDKGELNAEVQETASMENWSRAKVTFDAAYGHERVTAYLFLPNNASPPFQTVVYYPGAGAFLDDKLDLSLLEETRGFLLKSGRALIFPIYKGMYERRDGFRPSGPPRPLIVITRSRGRKTWGDRSTTSKREPTSTARKWPTSAIAQAALMGWSCWPLKSELRPQSFRRGGFSSRDATFRTLTRSTS
jgi:serine/threonine protein kinase/formylglycine-generating enzyme required for sulfatase activity